MAVQPLTEPASSLGLLVPGTGTAGPLTHHLRHVSASLWLPAGNAPKDRTDWVVLSQASWKRAWPATERWNLSIEACTVLALEHAARHELGRTETRGSASASAEAAKRSPQVAADAGGSMQTGADEGVIPARFCVLEERDVDPVLAVYRAGPGAASRVPCCRAVPAGRSWLWRS